MARERHLARATGAFASHGPTLGPCAHLRSGGSRAGAALVSLGLALPCCTTFADAELRAASDGGAGGGGTIASGGGEAGSGAGGVGASDAGGGFLPLLDAAHVCALVAECPTLGPSLVASLGLPVTGVEGGALDLRFSACLSWLTMPLADGRIGFEQQREVLFCVAASGCEGALGCLPIEVLAPTDARCDEGSTSSRCEGDRLVDCGARASARCGPPLFGPGTSCVELDAERASCGIDAACEEPLRCDGSFAVTCGDVLTTFDCAMLGLACREGAEASGGCATEEGPRPCAPDELGRSGCSADGERAYVCSGSRESQLDCDALGRTCDDAGGRARCASPEEACSPYDVDVDVCDGSVLSACVDGARVGVDCARIGRACAPASEGPSGSLSGRCRKLGD